MTNPQLMLSNQLCFLFYRVDRAIMAYYRPLLDELSLTYPQYLAMLVLWERGSATVGELCDALTLDTGTVSPLLKRLEQAGFIRRVRNPSDERSVTITLTDAGSNLEQRAARVPGALAHCIGLTMEEYTAWKQQLTSLLDTLDARTPGSC